MTTVTGNPDLRTEALHSLRRKQGLRVQVISYVVINLFLWGLWLVTGGAQDGGYWPAYVTLGWGAGLAIAAAIAYRRSHQRPISEADIDAEVRRMTGG